MRSERKEGYMSPEEIEVAIAEMIEELNSYSPRFWDRHPELQTMWADLAMEGGAKADNEKGERWRTKSHLEYLVDMVRSAAKQDSETG